MPGAARIGDRAACPMDAHGCQACWHGVKGPVVQGSKDVSINGKPAAHVGCRGIHGVCCGSNTFAIAEGAPSVFINGYPAARIGDRTAHCGGSGEIKTGSSDVIIGNGQARLFKKAAKSQAPFVDNIAANRKRRNQEWQQNMEYLNEKGISWADDSSKVPENFIQRNKRRLKNYLDERGTQKYSEGHYAAAYIDAIGSTMLDDVPETAGAATVGIGTDILFGKALKIIGKGGNLLLRNLDKLSEPLLSKVKTVFKKADAGKKLTAADEKVIAGALDEIEGRATKNNDFVGKLKGEPVQVSGVKTQRLKYTKRTPEAADELRKQFDSNVRKKFMKTLANDPKKVDAMKQAGIPDDAIEMMKKKGGVPDGYQVHHKIPLDDGGTNDFDNLVLIKNDPYHKVLTNAQKNLTKDLKPGQTIEVDFPTPEGFMYPTK